MVEKTPYIIDHNHIAKLVLKDYYQTIKIVFINTKESTFTENVDKNLKEVSLIHKLRVIA